MSTSIPKQVDMTALREAYGEYSNLCNALRAVLLVTVATNRIRVLVDGEQVPTNELTYLVEWEMEDDPSFGLDLGDDQADLTPALLADVDVEEIELHRTPEGVSLRPLLDALHPRVPTVLSLAHEMMMAEANVMKRYPWLRDAVPTLFFF